MFKISRMQDLPRRTSRPGAYEVPADLDLRALARALNPQEPNRTALLAVRVGKAPTLTRRGEPATTDRALPGGFEVFSVGYGDAAGAAEEISGYAADVIVLEPTELREDVL